MNLFSRIFLTLLVSGSAKAAIVIFQFQSPYGQAATPAVTLTPPGSPVTQSNTLVLGGITTFRWPANGLAVDAYGNTNFFGWTNSGAIAQLQLPLSAGAYTVQVAGYPRSFQLSVPVSTNVYYASDIASNVMILTPPTIVSVITNGGGSSSGTATNLTGAATNQVNAQALAQAQSVVATNQVPVSNLPTNGTWVFSGSIQAQQDSGGLGGIISAPAVVGSSAVISLGTGGFIGNGGPLTNLNASQLSSGTVPLSQLPTIVQTQTNAPTYFNDGVALTYLNAAHVTDLAARTDLIGSLNELQQYGFMSNLVDRVILKPRFNPTYNLSLFLRPVSNSGLIYTDSWGAYYNGTSAQTILNLPNLTTNTLVIVRRYPINVYTTNNFQFVGGVFNTNDFTGYYEGAGKGSWQASWARSGTNPITSASATANITMRYRGNGGWDTTGVEEAGRKYEIQVCMLGFTPDGLSAYFRHNQSKINYNTPSFLFNFATYTNFTLITSNLNQLVLGKDLVATYSGPSGGSGGWSGNAPYNGEICMADVYNCAPSTNLAIAVTRSARWLEPETSDQIYIADSRFAGTTVSGTNDALATFPLQYQFQHYEGNPNFIVNAVSGTDFSYGLNSSNLYFGAGEISKIVRNDIHVGFGYNDVYIDNHGWPQVLNDMLSFVSMATSASRRNVIHVFTPYSSSSNAPATYYSTAGESNLTAYINATVANIGSPNYDVIRQDLLVDQPTMDTNNLWSADYIHLGGPNMLAANRYLAQNANPAGGIYITIAGGVQGAASKTRTMNFTGNGSGLTNLNASQLTSGTVPLSTLPSFITNSIYGSAGSNNLLTTVGYYSNGPAVTIPQTGLYHITWNAGQECQNGGQSSGIFSNVAYLVISNTSPTIITNSSFMIRGTTGTGGPYPLGGPICPPVNCRLNSGQVITIEGIVNGAGVSGLFYSDGSWIDLKQIAP